MEKVTDSANYWNQIYKDKNEHEQSWYQEYPSKTLELISELNLAKTSRIIDIGGGESRLCDSLLDIGFSDITLLDISSKALTKTRERLGARSVSVTFIATDVLQFEPIQKFDLWHDRATFHFLTHIDDVEKYLRVAFEALEKNGFLIISTFSETGPEKCSGLPVTKYSQEELKRVFGKFFKNIKCFDYAHMTPSGKTQDFVYCGFKKINP